jgi:hypothetical protein
MGKRSEQVKQTQPHGRPMTPGNMRDPAGVLLEIPNACKPHLLDVWSAGTY